MEILFAFVVGDLKVVQPVLAGDLIACVLQAVPNVDHIALVDVAGAGAALDGRICAAAIQGDLALLRDWECIFVIFQQNHALCGNVPGKFCIADLAFGHFVRGRSRKGRRHS